MKENREKKSIARERICLEISGKCTFGLAFFTGRSIKYIRFLSAISIRPNALPIIYITRLNARGARSKLVNQTLDSCSTVSRLQLYRTRVYVRFVHQAAVLHHGHSFTNSALFMLITSWSLVTSGFLRNCMDENRCLCSRFPALDIYLFRGVYSFAFNIWNYTLQIHVDE